MSCLITTAAAAAVVTIIVLHWNGALACHQLNVLQEFQLPLAAGPS